MKLEEIFNPCLLVEIGWHAVRNIFLSQINIKLTFKSYVKSQSEVA